jgi:hypothetical protein
MVEIGTGAFAFAMVAVVAALLSVLVTFLERNQIAPLIVWGLIAGEHLLFVVDFVLFLRFVWAISKKFWRRFE